MKALSKESSSLPWRYRRRPSCFRMERSGRESCSLTLWTCFGIRPLFHGTSKRLCARLPTAAFHREADHATTGDGAGCAPGKWPQRSPMPGWPPRCSMISGTGSDTMSTLQGRRWTLSPMTTVTRENRPSWMTSPGSSMGSILLPTKFPASRQPTDSTGTALPMPAI